jgi:hypothetical protein
MTSAGERYFERVLAVARKSWELRAAWAKDPTDPQWENDAAIKDWIAWMSQYYPEGDRTSSFNVAGYNLGDGACPSVAVMRRRSHAREYYALNMFDGDHWATIGKVMREE